MLASILQQRRCRNAIGHERLPESFREVHQNTPIAVQKHRLSIPLPGHSSLNACGVVHSLRRHRSMVRQSSISFSYIKGNGQIYINIIQRVRAHKPKYLFRSVLSSLSFRFVGSFMVEFFFGLFTCSGNFSATLDTSGTRFLDFRFMASLRDFLLAYIFEGCIPRHTP
jgi:hypothetical protein